MIRRLSILLALAPALAGAQSVLPAPSSKAGISVNAPSTWKIDPTHSELSFTINRKDFNMTWNRIVEGSLMVGDEVRIEIDIAAVEQPQ